MFCDFIAIENNTYKCSRCGLIITAQDGQSPIFPCGAMNLDSKGPDFATKVKNFSQSLFNHTTNKFKMADDKEIERRFKICESCEFLKNQSCLQCGCPINRTRNYISKLSWDSEKCPIDKW